MVLSDFVDFENGIFARLSDFRMYIKKSIRMVIIQDGFSSLTIRLF